MVAEFPTFSKVTLEDKQFFDEFNAQFPPYADWAFGTLMTWWDAFDDLEASRLGGNLVIKSSYLSMGKNPQLVLLGNDNVDTAIETIFAFQRENGMSCELYSSPQHTIDALSNPEKFVIVEDPNAAEYVLSSQMHAELQGSEMGRIRRKVNQFEQTLGDKPRDIVGITLDNLHSKLLLINSLHQWQGLFRNDFERTEGLVLDKALLIAEDIDLRSLCLFIDQKLEGFVLYKPLPNGYIDVNHVKVSNTYPNTFRYMVHSLASYEFQRGTKFLNIEQDLGIEGLRTHKMLLHPVEKLHKFNIYPR